MKCNNCTQENNLDSKYCVNCGRPLKKHNTAIKVLLIVLGVYIFLGILALSGIALFFNYAKKNCNKHYEINTTELKKELNNYEIISSKEEKYNSIGFECRTKETVTKIHFNDIYNNSYEIYLYDSNHASLDKKNILKDVAKTQIMKNVLNDIFEYDKEEGITKTYDIDYGDKANIYIDMMPSYNDEIYKYDIKKDVYTITFNLYAYDDSKEEVINYSNEVIKRVSEKIGKENILKFNIQTNDKNYSFVEIDNGVVKWE